MISALTEVTFYWTWLIISVWGNEPKLKETTDITGRLKSIHVRTLSQWTNTPESYGLLLYLLLKLPGITACSTVFPYRFNLKISKLKRKVIFNSCWDLLYFTFSLLTVLVSRLSSGWNYTVSFWDFSVIFAVTAYNVGVFQPIVRDLNNFNYWSTKFVQCVFCAVKVWFIERQAKTRIA